MKREGSVWVPTQKLSLAVFVTPSLREILKIFGDKILVLHGSGAKQIEKFNKKDVGGFEFRQIRNGSCKINYSRQKNGTLTSARIKRINKILDSYGLADCAVEYLKVEIVDEHLKNIINEFYEGKINFKCLTNTFHAELKLEKCEGVEDREKWEEIPYNKNILTPASFKRSMLHCIKLIDDGQVYNLKKQSRRFYYINWEPGNRSINIEDLNSPVEIVSALKTNFEPYGYVKNYKVDKQNKLILTGIS